MLKQIEILATKYADQKWYGNYRFWEENFEETTIMPWYLEKGFDTETEARDATRKNAISHALKAYSPETKVLIRG